MEARYCIFFFPNYSKKNSVEVYSRTDAMGKTERKMFVKLVKLSINNHIVGFSSQNTIYIIDEYGEITPNERVCYILYHTACEVEFQLFNRSFSQLTFSYFSKYIFILTSFKLLIPTVRVLLCEVILLRQHLLLTQFG